MKSNRSIIVIAHNIRSAHNIGALLRLSDGLGVAKVIISGYSPYPLLTQDPRLPHVAKRAHQQIAKTALGAEHTCEWEYQSEVTDVIQQLIIDGYTVAALEQSPSSVPLPSYTPPEKVALLLGSEVTGIAPDLLKKISPHLEIPMYGKKESFNVATAAAMALYHFRFC